MRQEAFAVAEELAVRLRTVPGPTRSRVYGFVEALMGHPTRNDPRPSGEARFRLFEEGEELPTRAELSPADYAVAGAAHLAGDPVSFRGILHRLPRLSRVEQVAGFRRLRLEEDGAPDEVAAPPAATF